MNNYSVVEVSDDKSHHTRANIEGSSALMRALGLIKERDDDAKLCIDAGLKRARVTMVYVVGSNPVTKLPALYTIHGNKIAEAIEEIKAQPEEY